MIARAWLIMQFVNIDRQVEQITEFENEDAESEVMIMTDGDPVNGLKNT